jgi:hypothetical protein
MTRQQRRKLEREKMKQSKPLTEQQMREVEKNGLLKNEGNSYNNIDYSNYNSSDEFFDEMNEIRDVIEDKLGDYIGGTSIEGNGVNFNFTFNEKPFHLRIKVDKYHTELWKKEKRGYWKE